MFGQNKRKNAFCNRILAATLVFTLTWTTIAWSAPELNLSSGQKIKNLSDEISSAAPALAKELGTVEETFIPESCLENGSNCPLVVYLQDAHANLGAQQSIQKIAGQLSEKLNIQTILTEGASGEADMSALRAYPHQKVKELTTQFWLKQVVLTAMEAEAIVSAKPYRLIGIEDQKAYDENGSYFLKALDIKKELSSVIHELIVKNNDAREKVFNKKLLDFERKVETHELRGELIQLISYLANIGRDEGVKRSDLLQIEKLVSLILLERALEGKDKQEQSDEQKQFQQLARELEAKGLFNDIDILKERIREKLFRNKKEKALSQEGIYLKILEALIFLKATPQDFAFYEGCKKQILEFVKENKIDPKAIDPAEAFYRSNRTREEAFYGNIMKNVGAIHELPLLHEAEGARPVPVRTGTNPAKRAFLVTGGYHTKPLTQRFREAGIPFILISPQVSPDTNDERYYERIKGERIDLEKFQDRLKDFIKGSARMAPLAVFGGERDQLLKSFEEMQKLMKGKEASGINGDGVSSSADVRETIARAVSRFVREIISRLELRNLMAEKGVAPFSAAKPSTAAHESPRPKEMSYYRANLVVSKIRTGSNKYARWQELSAKRAAAGSKTETEEEKKAKARYDVKVSEIQQLIEELIRGKNYSVLIFVRNGLTRAVQDPQETDLRREFFDDYLTMVNQAIEAIEAEILLQPEARAKLEKFKQRGQLTPDMLAQTVQEIVLAREAVGRRAPFRVKHKDIQLALAQKNMPRSQSVISELLRLLLSEANHFLTRYPALRKLSRTSGGRPREAVDLPLLAGLIRQYKGGMSKVVEEYNQQSEGKKLNIKTLMLAIKTTPELTQLYRGFLRVQKPPLSTVVPPASLPTPKSELRLNPGETQTFQEFLKNSAPDSDEWRKFLERYFRLFPKTWKEQPEGLRSLFPDETAIFDLMSRGEIPAMNYGTFFKLSSVYQAFKDLVPVLKKENLPETAESIVLPGLDTVKVDGWMFRASESAGAKHPVFILLPPWGKDASWLLKTAQILKREYPSYHIVALNYHGPFGRNGKPILNSGGIVESYRIEPAVRALLAQTDLNIDRTQVIGVGYSEGANILTLIQKRSPLFSALAPVGLHATYAKALLNYHTNEFLPAVSRILRKYDFIDWTNPNVIRHSENTLIESRLKMNQFVIRESKVPVSMEGDTLSRPQDIFPELQVPVFMAFEEDSGMLNDDVRDSYREAAEKLAGEGRQIEFNIYPGKHNEINPETLVAGLKPFLSNLRPELRQAEESSSKASKQIPAYDDLKHRPAYMIRLVREKFFINKILGGRESDAIHSLVRYLIEIPSAVTVRVAGLPGATILKRDGRYDIVDFILREQFFVPIDLSLETLTYARLIPEKGQNQRDAENAFRFDQIVSRLKSYRVGSQVSIRNLRSQFLLREFREDGTPGNYRLAEEVPALLGFEPSEDDSSILVRKRFVKDVSNEEKIAVLSRLRSELDRTKQVLSQPSSSPIDSRNEHRSNSSSLNVAALPQTAAKSELREEEAKERPAGDAVAVIVEEPELDLDKLLTPGAKTRFGLKEITEKLGTMEQLSEKQLHQVVDWAEPQIHDSANAAAADSIKALENLRDAAKARLEELEAEAEDGKLPKKPDASEGEQSEPANAANDASSAEPAGQASDISGESKAATKSILSAKDKEIVQLIREIVDFDGRDASALLEKPLVRSMIQRMTIEQLESLRRSRKESLIFTWLYIARWIEDDRTLNPAAHDFLARHFPKRSEQVSAAIPKTAAAPVVAEKSEKVEQPAAEEAEKPADIQERWERFWKKLLPSESKDQNQWSEFDWKRKTTLAAMIMTAGVQSRNLTRIEKSVRYYTFPLRIAATTAGSRNLIFSTSLLDKENSSIVDQFVDQQIKAALDHLDIVAPTEQHLLKRRLKIWARELFLVVQFEGSNGNTSLKPVGFVKQPLYETQDVPLSLSPDEPGIIPVIQHSDIEATPCEHRVVDLFDAARLTNGPLNWITDEAAKQMRKAMQPTERAKTTLLRALEQVPGLPAETRDEIMRQLEPVIDVFALNQAFNGSDAYATKSLSKAVSRVGVIKTQSGKTVLYQENLASRPVAVGLIYYLRNNSWLSVEELEQILGVLEPREQQQAPAGTQEASIPALSSSQILGLEDQKEREQFVWDRLSDMLHVVQGLSVADRDQILSDLRPAIPIISNDKDTLGNRVGFSDAFAKRLAQKLTVRRNPNGQTFLREGEKEFPATALGFTEWLLQIGFLNSIELSRIKTAILGSVSGQEEAALGEYLRLLDRVDSDVKSGMISPDIAISDVRAGFQRFAHRLEPSRMESICDWLEIHGVTMDQRGHWEGKPYQEARTALREFLGQDASWVPSPEWAAGVADSKLQASWSSSSRVRLIQKILSEPQPTERLLLIREHLSEIETWLAPVLSDSEQKGRRQLVTGLVTDFIKAHGENVTSFDFSGYLFPDWVTSLREKFGYAWVYGHFAGKSMIPEQFIDYVLAHFPKDRLLSGIFSRHKMEALSNLRQEYPALKDLSREKAVPLAFLLESLRENEDEKSWKSVQKLARRLRFDRFDDEGNVWLHLPLGRRILRWVFNSKKDWEEENEEGLFKNVFVETLKFGTGGLLGPATYLIFGSGIAAFFVGVLGCYVGLFAAIILTDTKLYSGVKKWYQVGGSAKRPATLENIVELLLGPKRPSTVRKLVRPQQVDARSELRGGDEIESELSLAPIELRTARHSESTTPKPELRSNSISLSIAALPQTAAKSELRASGRPGEEQLRWLDEKLRLLINSTLERNPHKGITEGVLQALKGGARSLRRNSAKIRSFSEEFWDAVAPFLALDEASKMPESLEEKPRIDVVSMTHVLEVTARLKQTAGDDFHANGVITHNQGGSILRIAKALAAINHSVHLSALAGSGTVGSLFKELLRRFGFSPSSLHVINTKRDTLIQPAVMAEDFRQEPVVEIRIDIPHSNVQPHESKDRLLDLLSHEVFPYTQKGNLMIVGGPPLEGSGIGHYLGLTRAAKEKGLKVVFIIDPSFSPKQIEEVFRAKPYMIRLDREGLAKTAKKGILELERNTPLTIKTARELIVEHGNELILVTSSKGEDTVFVGKGVDETYQTRSKATRAVDVDVMTARLIHGLSLSASLPEAFEFSMAETETQPPKKVQADTKPDEKPVTDAAQIKHSLNDTDLKSWEKLLEDIGHIKDKPTKQAQIAALIGSHMTEEWMSNLDNSILADALLPEDIDFNGPPPSFEPSLRLRKVESLLHKTIALLNDIKTSGAIPRLGLLPHLPVLDKHLEEVALAIDKREQQRGYFEWDWQIRKFIFDIEDQLHRYGASDPDLPGMLEASWREVQKKYEIYGRQVFLDFKRLGAHPSLEVTKKRLLRTTINLENAVRLFARVIKNASDTTLRGTSLSENLNGQLEYLQRNIHQKWAEYYQGLADQSLNEFSDDKYWFERGRNDVEVPKLEELLKQAKHDLTAAKFHLDAAVDYAAQRNIRPPYQLQMRAWAEAATKYLIGFKFMSPTNSLQIEIMIQDWLSKIEEMFEQSFTEGGGYHLSTHFARVDFYMGFGLVNYAAELLHMAIRVDGLHKITKISPDSARKQFQMNTQSAIIRALMIERLSGHPLIEETLHNIIADGDESGIRVLRSYAFPQEGDPKEDLPQDDEEGKKPNLSLEALNRRAAVTYGLVVAVEGMLEDAKRALLAHRAKQAHGGKAKSAPQGTSDDAVLEKKLSSRGENVAVDQVEGIEKRDLVSYIDRSFENNLFGTPAEKNLRLVMKDIPPSMRKRVEIFDIIDRIERLTEEDLFIKPEAEEKSPSSTGGTPIGFAGETNIGVLIDSIGRLIQENVIGLDERAKLLLIRSVKEKLVHGIFQKLLSQRRENAVFVMEILYWSDAFHKWHKTLGSKIGGEGLEKVIANWINRGALYEDSVPRQNFKSSSDIVAFLRTDWETQELAGNDRLLLERFLIALGLIEEKDLKAYDTGAVRPAPSIGRAPQGPKQSMLLRGGKVLLPPGFLSYFGRDHESHFTRAARWAARKQVKEKRTEGSTKKPREAIFQVFDELKISCTRAFYLLTEAEEGKALPLITDIAKLLDTDINFILGSTEPISEDETVAEPGKVPAAADETKPDQVAPPAESTAPIEKTEPEKTEVPAPLVASPISPEDSSLAPPAAPSEPSSHLPILTLLSAERARQVSGPLFPDALQAGPIGAAADITVSAIQPTAEPVIEPSSAPVTSVPPKLTAPLPPAQTVPGPENIEQAKPKETSGAAETIKEPDVAEKTAPAPPDIPPSQDQPTEPETVIEADKSAPVPAEPVLTRQARLAQAQADLKNLQARFLLDLPAPVRIELMKEINFGSLDGDAAKIIGVAKTHPVVQRPYGKGFRNVVQENKWSFKDEWKDKKPDLDSMKNSLKGSNAAKILGKLFGKLGNSDFLKGIAALGVDERERIIGLTMKLEQFAGAISKLQSELTVDDHPEPIEPIDELPRVSGAKPRYAEYVAGHHDRSELRQGTVPLQHKFRGINQLRAELTKEIKLGVPDGEMFSIVYQPGVVPSVPEIANITVLNTTARDIDDSLFRGEEPPWFFSNKKIKVKLASGTISGMRENWYKGRREPKIREVLHAAPKRGFDIVLHPEEKSLFLVTRGLQNEMIIVGEIEFLNTGYVYIDDNGRPEFKENLTPDEIKLKNATKKNIILVHLRPSAFVPSYDELVELQKLQEDLKEKIVVDCQAEWENLSKILNGRLDSIAVFNAFIDDEKRQRFVRGTVSLVQNRSYRAERQIIFENANKMKEKIEKMVKDSLSNPLLRLQLEAGLFHNLNLFLEDVQRLREKRKIEKAFPFEKGLEESMASWYKIYFDHHMKMAGDLFQETTGEEKIAERLADITQELERAGLYLNAMKHLASPHYHFQSEEGALGDDWGRVESRLRRVIEMNKNSDKIPYWRRLAEKALKEQEHRYKEAVRERGPLSFYLYLGMARNAVVNHKPISKALSYLHELINFRDLIHITGGHVVPDRRPVIQFVLCLMGVGKYGEEVQAKLQKARKTKNREEINSVLSQWVAMYQGAPSENVEPVDEDGRPLPGNRLYAGFVLETVLERIEADFADPKKSPNAEGWDYDSRVNKVIDVYESLFDADLDRKLFPPKEEEVINKIVKIRNEEGEVVKEVVQRYSLIPKPRQIPADYQNYHPFPKRDPNLLFLLLRWSRALDGQDVVKRTVNQILEEDIFSRYKDQRGGFTAESVQPMFEREHWVRNLRGISRRIFNNIMYEIGLMKAETRSFGGVVSDLRAMIEEAGDEIPGVVTFNLYSPQEDMSVPMSMVARQGFPNSPPALLDWPKFFRAVGEASFAGDRITDLIKSMKALGEAGKAKGTGPKGVLYEDPFTKNYSSSQQKWFGEVMSRVIERADSKMTEWQEANFSDTSPLKKESTEKIRMEIEKLIMHYLNEEAIKKLTPEDRELYQSYLNETRPDSQPLNPRIDSILRKLGVELNRMTEMFNDMMKQTVAQLSTRHKGDKPAQEGFPATGSDKVAQILWDLYPEIPYWVEVRLVAVDKQKIKDRPPIQATVTTKAREQFGQLQSIEVAGQKIPIKYRSWIDEAAKASPIDRLRRSKEFDEHNAKIVITIPVFPEEQKKIDTADFRKVLLGSFFMTKSEAFPPTHSHHALTNLSRLELSQSENNFSAEVTRNIVAQLIEINNRKKQSLKDKKTVEGIVLGRAIDVKMTPDEFDRFLDIYHKTLQPGKQAAEVLDEEGMRVLRKFHENFETFPPNPTTGFSDLLLGAMRDISDGHYAQMRYLFLERCHGPGKKMVFKLANLLLKAGLTVDQMEKLLNHLQKYGPEQLVGLMVDERGLSAGNALFKSGVTSEAVNLWKIVENHFGYLKTTGSDSNAILRYLTNMAKDDPAKKDSDRALFLRILALLSARKEMKGKGDPNQHRVIITEGKALVLRNSHSPETSHSIRTPYDAEPDVARRVKREVTDVEHVMGKMLQKVTRGSPMFYVFHRIKHRAQKIVKTSEKNATLVLPQAIKAEIETLNKTGQGHLGKLLEAEWKPKILNEVDQLSSLEIAGDENTTKIAVKREVDFFNSCVGAVMSAMEGEVFKLQDKGKSGKAESIFFSLAALNEDAKVIRKYIEEKRVTAKSLLQKYTDLSFINSLEEDVLEDKEITPIISRYVLKLEAIRRRGGALNKDQSTWEEAVENVYQIMALLTLGSSVVSQGATHSEEESRTNEERRRFNKALESIPKDVRDAAAYIDIWKGTDIKDMGDLKSRVSKKIEEEHWPAELALQQVIRPILNKIRWITGDRGIETRTRFLLALTDATTREFQGQEKFLEEENLVLVVDHMSFSLWRKIRKAYPNIRAIITPGGTPAAHWAILAGSEKILTLTSARSAEKILDWLNQIGQLQEIYVDGQSGEIIANPSWETKGRFEREQMSEETISRLARATAMQETRTKDGAVALNVGGNAASRNEVNDLEELADRIGLFRTEFSIPIPFNPSGHLLSEKYIEDLSNEILFAAQRMSSGVVVRLLDREQDKQIRGLPSSPFWGLDYLLQDPIGNKEILKAQMKSVFVGAFKFLSLSSSKQPDLKPLILVEAPLVKTRKELEQLRATFDEVRTSFLAEHKGDSIAEAAANSLLGMMIETPEAVEGMDDLFNLADFGSFGTNDLTASLMSKIIGFEVKREDPNSAFFFINLQPSILKAAREGVRTAAEKKKLISVCGELAGNLRFVLWAIYCSGLYDGPLNLSVEPSRVARVKQFIRFVDFGEVKEWFGKIDLDSMITLDRKGKIKDADEYKRSVEELNVFVKEKVNMILNRIKETQEYQKEYEVVRAEFIQRKVRRRAERNASVSGTTDNVTANVAPNIVVPERSSKPGDRTELRAKDSKRSELRIAAAVPPRFMNPANDTKAEVASVSGNQPSTFTGNIEGSVLVSLDELKQNDALRESIAESLRVNPNSKIDIVIVTSKRADEADGMLRSWFGFDVFEKRDGARNRIRLFAQEKLGFVNDLSQAYSHSIDDLRVRFDPEKDNRSLIKRIAAIGQDTMLRDIRQKVIKLSGPGSIQAAELLISLDGGFDYAKLAPEGIIHSTLQFVESLMETFRVDASLATKA